MNDNKPTRRQFLAASVAAGAASLGARRAPQNNAPKLPHLVRVHDPKVQPKPEELEFEVVKAMLFRGMRRLTGTTSDAEAWKSLFAANEVVGIKVNGLFGPGARTHPEVALAVAEGLKLAGIKPENIIIWDRTDHDLAKSGFELNRDGPGVQCYGTERDYDAEKTTNGSFSGRLSKILSTKIDALVNVPILKDHGISGITAAFKNHYGSIDNPGQQHQNHCHPYLADLNAVPAIRSKTRLIVCDAIRPLCNGGPGASPDYFWECNQLLLSRDPVALDALGLEIIDKRRTEIGIPKLADAGRPVHHIARAIQLGLGVGNLDGLEIVTA